MPRKLPVVLITCLLLPPPGVCTCHAALPACAPEHGHDAHAAGDGEDGHAPDAGPCCPGHRHDHHAPGPADHAPGCPALKTLDRPREAAPDRLAALAAYPAGACLADPAPADVPGRFADPPARSGPPGRPLFLTLRTLLI